MNVKQRIKRIPLETKILLLIIVCLVSGFGSYVIYSIREESQALLKQHREKSSLFAQTLKAGIRNVMLSGRAAYVRSFIEESREEFQSIGRLRIFNNKGKEIYPHSSPFISIPLIDESLQEIVQNNQFSDSLVPLFNEKQCQTCHTSDHEIRGAIHVTYSDNRSPFMSAQIIQQAFEVVMLSGKGEMADSLLNDLSENENVNLVQVWDSYGYYIAFGDDQNTIPAKIIEPIATEFQDHPNKSHTIVNHKKYGLLIFLPLLNSISCHVCHGSDDQIRGILVVALNSLQQDNETIITENIVDGFKNLMLLQKASHIFTFTNRIRNLPFIKSLRVFDNGKKLNGQVQELYVKNPNHSLSLIDSSIVNFISIAQTSKNHILERIDSIDDENYLTQVIPLENDVKCQGCHNPPKNGSPLYDIEKDVWKVRCVVEVSTSMTEIQNAIQRNTRASLGIGIITLFIIAMLLKIFMKIMVLKPLEIIGNTAQKIGLGDLSVNANVGSKDEIGVLAQRMNEMIQGLRERLHLTKFVSDDTVAAVGAADLTGVELGGERRDATVLFSDIRGFTSYSEKVEPEEVISMLNTFLNHQADIVKENGGDIDKFVGDELMAIFKGKNMVEDAIQCAIDIQRKMEVLNQDTKDSIGIGIGINAGPMVMGAMGSKERMDYTVIGDNVNLGARLCSAAKAGEIIISQSAVSYLQNSLQFKLEEQKAIQVKGKQSLIKIFTVDYSSIGRVDSG